MGGGRDGNSKGACFSTIEPALYEYREQTSDFHSTGYGKRYSINLALPSFAIRPAPLPPPVLLLILPDSKRIAKRRKKGKLRSFLDLRKNDCMPDGWMGRGRQPFPIYRSAGMHVRGEWRRSKSNIRSSRRQDGCGVYVENYRQLYFLLAPSSACLS